MDKRRLVTVKKLSNPLEAELMKNWLQSEGVNAYVEGSEASTMLAYAGNAIVVRLLVDHSDVDRARALIVKFEEESASSGKSAWYCGVCREMNEPAFEVCWKCQGHREVVESSRPENYPLQTKSKEVTPYGDPRDPRSSKFAVAEAGNPYRPVNIDSVVPSQGDTLSLDEAEEMVTRAWRAALLSPGLPVFLNLYSIVLLLGSLDTNARLSFRSRRRRYIAWVINVLALSIPVVIFISLYVVKPSEYWE